MGLGSRGCMDQAFAVRQVCEKYLANGKDVFWAFVDLENAYDTIDRQWERCIGLLSIWKRPMILSIDMVCGRC